MPEASIQRKMARGSALRFALLGAILLIVLAVCVAFYVGVRDEFSMATIEQAIRSWGSWGVAGSIGLMVVHSFIPFPAEFLAIANGMVYGLVWGAVITWIGAMLGAFSAFGLSRWLGRPFVEALVGRKKWQVIDAWASESGWQVILVSRFFPVVAFNLVNYAAGLTGISWWTFAWTTGLGILPATVLMVAMGTYAHFMSWETWLLLAVVGLVLWFILRGRRSLGSGRKRRSEASNSAANRASLGTGSGTNDPY